MSFAKVGLVPDFGAFFLLPRAVGMPMAKELAFTARKVEVAEAKSLGLCIRSMNRTRWRTRPSASPAASSPRRAPPLR